MVAQLISGTEISKKVLSDVGEQLKKTREAHPNFNAVLAIVQAEYLDFFSFKYVIKLNLHSNVYIGIGAEGKLIKLPDTITQSELEREIDKLNNDDNIDGIIVQLPLDCKNKIDADSVIDRINQLKDVDGLTRENAGRLMRGELDRTIFPCTPFGCLYLVQQLKGYFYFAYCLVLQLTSAGKCSADITQVDKVFIVYLYIQVFKSMEDSGENVITVFIRLVPFIVINVKYYACNKHDKISLYISLMCMIKNYSSFQSYTQHVLYSVTYCCITEY
uniref:methenyltetrahydrofolate cyclohydrolase n=1 Tax=Heterorhabditis bacteriophora TaxID=37862 RepID=A0A1I7WPU1_HETBA